MKLGGYVRVQEPRWSEPWRRKLLFALAAVGVHVVLFGGWFAASALWASDEETIEVVRYFDISPIPAEGEADAASAPPLTTQPSRSAPPGP